MKRVGVREFRDHATQYLAIERHGQPIGFYIPTGKSRQENFQEALARLEQTVGQVLAETGLSEDQLARLFDLNEPLPEEREKISTVHAPRR